jgi:hypothetical protein
LVVLLLALVIVAVLAQTALRHYGLLAAADAPARGENRHAGDSAPLQPDSATLAPTPTTALERARGVDNTVRKQTEELGRQIEDTAK